MKMCLWHSERQRSPVSPVLNAPWETDSKQLPQPRVRNVYKILLTSLSPTSETKMKAAEGLASS